jgi:uncharacterized phiE125 gp8 family phage protein
MGLVLVTAPAAEPVSLDEAKAQCRVGDTASDALLTRLITVARHYCEEETRRALITQTRRLTLDDFPVTPIRLTPRLLTVVSVVHEDADFDDVALDGDDYALSADEEPGRLTPRLEWPTTSGRPGNVRVTFTCGYGAAASNVPEPIRHAILLCVTHWYDHRGDDDPPDLPPAVGRLLLPFTVQEVV